VVCTLAGDMLLDMTILHIRIPTVRTHWRVGWWW
jgi:hypothetical protein